MRRFLGLAGALCAALIAVPALALPAPQLVRPVQINTSAVFPITYYSQYSNGLPANPNFFPLGVYLQNPSNTGKSALSTVGASARAAGFNILFGIDAGSGSLWPLTFGGDGGQFANAVTNKLYVFSGGDPASNTSAMSVASVLSLATTDGGLANIIGYDWADEPNCPRTVVPTQVAAVSGYDSTRLTGYNMASWVSYWGSFPALSSCPSTSPAAFTAPAIPSFDTYPVIAPNYNFSTSYCPGGAHVQSGDFNTVPYDCLWIQGLGTQNALGMIAGTKPFWQFMDTGSNALGESGGVNSFTGSTTSGSAILAQSGTFTKFSAAWIGLTVAGTGIPGATTILSITDSTHAVMSATATASGSPSVTVTGGVYNDCVLANNICVVNSNEHRATAAQVNSEAWMSIINGATGLLYFCDDLTASVTSLSWCLGDPAGGAAATAAYNNLTYVNSVITSYAPILNSPTVGLCSMQNATTLATGTNCTNGILTMATGTAACPGAALAKSFQGATYLVAQSARTSLNNTSPCNNAGAGAVMTFTLAGLGGRLARVVYDSDAKYDSSNLIVGNTFQLSGSGQFSDVIGANSDSYQVKIYKVQ